MPSLMNAVVCMDCGHSMAFDPLPAKCESCGSVWLEARYDLEQAASRWREGLSDRATSVWRYEELLPIKDAASAITIGEGWTPLFRTMGLGRELDHQHLYIKDERQSPTGSFKDRQGALTITYLKQEGIRECVMASTGNKAAAYAAFSVWGGGRQDHGHL
jgi:threonine synthase